MNIAVLTHEGHCIVRPDTTLDKKNEDFFPPDGVTAVDFTTVLFARICKPGRSIQPQFASRYFDTIGFGTLLYPADFLKGGEQDFASAICMDHTSYLPGPMFAPAALSCERNSFTLFKGKERVFSYDVCGSEAIERAIVACSSLVYLRASDLLCTELHERRRLVSAAEVSASIRGTFCGQETLGYRIRF